MPILVNGLKFDVGVALRDEKHPMYSYALQYTQGLAELKEKHGKVIKFIRPGFPKTNLGSDSRGNATTIVEPTPPAIFPLEKVYAHPTRGEEIWSCCLQMPQLLPNGLWSIGKKKGLKITDFINVDIDRQPDLAFYLYYIAKFDRGGRLQVDDPKVELRTKAIKVREELDRKDAVWNMLSDDALRRMAAAYNVPNSGTAEPDQLRFDLEAQLEINDKKRGNDPMIKGTREFLEEMKVTDNVRLRALIKTLIDDKKLVYKPDGRFRLGDKLLMQVPQTEIGRTFEYICGYYSMTTNSDKLVELLRDVVNKEFLDNIVDDKDFVWLAKTMNINTAFKTKSELRSKVYEVFSLAL